jgi:hypothetical protein
MFENWVFSMSHVSRIANILFFLLLLAGTFYQYFQWHLHEYLGIHPVEHFKGIAVLFFIFVIITTIVGVILVSVLEIWKYQLFVGAVKRNQYSRDTYVPKEINFNKKIMLPLFLYLRTGEKKHLDECIESLKEIAETGKLKYGEEMKKFERVI